MRRTGFSLLEMTMVLLILSIVAALFVAHQASVITDAKKELTQSRMQTIQDTIVEFRQLYHRLPCPADGTMTIASHNLGIEAATPGTCIGAPAPAANYSGIGSAVAPITGPIVIGAVPTKSLGLGDDFMYDAWGRKITYAVDPRATAYTPNCAFTTAPLSSLTDITARLIVNDESGNDRTTTTINGTLAGARALYVLVSHGPNGHGAFLPSGAIENSGSQNVQEQTNCHCDVNAAVSPSATTVSSIFVARLAADNSGNPQNRFDDIVAYATREQILSQAEQNGLTGGETCP